MHPDSTGLNAVSIGWFLLATQGDFRAIQRARGMANATQGRFLELPIGLRVPADFLQTTILDSSVRSFSRFR
jgi:hypothetical protein